MALCSFTATLFGSNKRFQALHKWVPIPLGAKDEHNGKGAFYCRMKDHSVVTWPVLVAAKGVGIGVGGSSTKKFPFFTRTTEEEVSIGAVGIGVTEGPAQLVGNTVVWIAPHRQRLVLGAVWRQFRNLRARDARTA
jgi:hypothetical protein